MLDKETQLDKALANRRAGPAGEVADYVAVVDHLQILASAPEPRLMNGRHRVVAEAARLNATPREWRPAFAFAIGVVVVLLVVGATLLLVQSSSSSPTLIPTYTVTPTRIAVVPLHRSIPSMNPMLQPAPKPVPMPLPTHVETLPIYHSADMVLLRCLMF